MFLPRRWFPTSIIPWFLSRSTIFAFFNQSYNLLVSICFVHPKKVWNPFIRSQSFPKASRKSAKNVLNEERKADNNLMNGKRFIFFRGRGLHHWLNRTRFPPSFMAELLSQSIRHTPKSLKLRPTHIRIFPVRKSNGVKGSPLSWEVASQWMNRQRFSSSLSLFLDPWERREREEREAITEAIAYKKEP